MIPFTIEEGRLDDVLEVLALIPEFENIPDAVSIQSRLAGKPHLILSARNDCGPLGFKIGYERDGKFYSWLGAVDPAFRTLSVGNRLADEQERWVKDHGYQYLWMKTRNCFPAMLIMALRRGFQIQQIIPYEDHLQNRIILEKTLV